MQPATMKQKDVQYCDMDSDCVKATPLGCNKLKTKNETNNARRMVDKLGVYNRKLICISSLMYHEISSNVLTRL